MMDVSTLLTVGQLARHLGEPVHRVHHVVRTRPHIQPIGRAGILRLFGPAALDQVKAELAQIDAKRLRSTGGAR